MLARWLRHGGLVLARIIEPTSKLGSVRVLTEAGIAPACYATLKRRLPAYAEPSWREDLAAACAVDGRAVSGVQPRHRHVSMLSP